MHSNFLSNIVKKYNLTKALFVCYNVAIAIILYFTFFTVFGDKGLTKYFDLKNQIANKDVVKNALIATVDSKKHLINAMNISSLDLDLLDEQARRVLGYVGKNEVVIYHEKIK